MHPRFLPVFALLASVFAMPVPSATAQQQTEYVIVSGGVSLMQWEQYKQQPHDRWWLNFIRAARLRIEEIRNEHGSDALISWHVYAPAYKRRMREESADMFGIINSVQQTYGVRLHFFTTGGYVIDYLNNGQPRDRVKIAVFDYFGHSNKACFMFDYSNEIDSASKAWLHENDVKKVRRDIWARGAYAKSWGCYTGESMSQKWRSATGVPMIGAVGKTQYETHILPSLATAAGRWTQ